PSPTRRRRPTHRRARPLTPRGGDVPEPRGDGWPQLRRLRRGRHPLHPRGDAEGGSGPLAGPPPLGDTDRPALPLLRPTPPPPPTKPRPPAPRAASLPSPPRPPPPRGKTPTSIPRRGPPAQRRLESPTPPATRAASRLTRGNTSTASSASSTPPFWTGAKRAD